MKSIFFTILILGCLCSFSNAQNFVLTNEEVQLLQQDEQAKSADLSIQQSAIASDNADMNSRLGIVNQEQMAITDEQDVIDQWNNAQNNSIN